jgi:alkanesulfonate monooxygenase SsuD/methylene tetrahydromethanopterin reductase-like flavin-dependent oxidoreductase (luciferase family)
MKIGLMFVNAGPLSEPDLFRTLVLSAEDNGFESIWTVEHAAIPDGFKSPYPYSASGKLGNMDDFPLPDPFSCISPSPLRLPGEFVLVLPS